MDILAARKKAAERAKQEAKPPQPSDERSDAPPKSSPGEPGPAQSAEIQVMGPQSSQAEATPADQPADASGASSGEATPEPQAREVEMLSFRLGPEEYIVPIEQVREVLKTRDLTPVPNTPDFILGVTSLRGAILPVIDLCKRLGLASRTSGEKSRILVVSLAEEDVGLVVDRVTGVVRFLPDAIRPAPETLEQGAEFLRGIVRKEDKLFILLDVEKTVER